MKSQFATISTNAHGDWLQREHSGDFLDEIRETCIGFGARKGYTNGGPEESDELGSLLKALGVAQDMPLARLSRSV